MPNVEDRLNKKKKMFSIVGAIITIAGLIFIISFGSEIKPNNDDWIIPVILGIIGIGIGICIILFGRMQFKKEKHRLEESGQIDKGLSPVERKMTGILQVYPKISLKDLAEKMGMDEKLVEESLVDLVQRGHVKGHIDPGTREFISAMSTATGVASSAGKALTCPHCGATLPSIPVRGTSVKCKSCGNLIIN